MSASGTAAALCFGYICDAAATVRIPHVQWELHECRIVARSQM